MLPLPDFIGTITAAERPAHETICSAVGGVQFHARHDVDLRAGRRRVARPARAQKTDYGSGSRRSACGTDQGIDDHIGRKMETLYADHRARTLRRYARPL